MKSNTVANILLQAIIGCNDGPFFNRLVLKFLMWLRQLIVKIFDPVVDYKLCSQKLFLPLSHDLPIYRKMYPSYSNNLLEIVKIIDASINNLSIIDIGANIGDSVVLMRNVSNAKILAIEPESVYYRFLKKNVSDIKSVKTVNEYLGEKDATKYMQLTRSNGSATFRKSRYGRNGTKIRKLDSVLKEYPEFLSANFIKVDTDGFDYLILRGARSYLKKSKPIIFFEYWPKGLNDVGEDGIEFIKYLASLGYSKSIVFDNFGRYFLSVDLTDTNLMLDLHNYVKRNKALERNDYDICAFLKEDEIIYDKIRSYYLKK